MPASLAERIVAAMERRRLVVDKAFGQINIVYIEGLNPDGSPNGDAPNAFNDLRVCIRFENEVPKIVGAWEATTEPGTRYIKAPINPKGAAIIAFGQYRAWRVGTHHAGSASAHEALVQTGGDVTVFRDANRDGLRTGDAEDTGAFGINQHWGYDLARDDVRSASAGCLVGRTREGHREFMRIVKSDPRYLVDPTFVFRTAILPEADVLQDAAPAARPATVPDLRRRMAQRILDYEARRDAKGRLAVYRLPAGDGGGTYEVAGINDRYHPQKADELRQLVEAGRQDEAERVAVDYVAAYTDAVTGWAGDPGVEFFLRDCAFNRGPTGAARILQLAVGVRQDGVVREGGETRAAVAKLSAADLLTALRRARETYERQTVGRDETSKFWAGLVVRWDKALAFGRQLSAEAPVRLPPKVEDTIKGGTGVVVGGGAAAGVQQGWGVVEWAIAIAVVLVVVGLAWAAWRWWKRRRAAAAAEHAVTAAPEPQTIPDIPPPPPEPPRSTERRRRGTASTAKRRSGAATKRPRAAKQKGKANG